MNANDAVGGNLYAVTDVPVYTVPMGAVKKTYKKGAFMGTIDSWTTRDGFVWWRLTNGEYVKHAEGMLRIDKSGTDSVAHEAEVKRLTEAANKKDILDKASEATEKVITGVGDAVGGAGKALSGIGENFNTILLVLGAIIVIGSFWYLSKVSKV